MNRFHDLYRHGQERGVRPKLSFFKLLRFFFFYEVGFSNLFDVNKFCQQIISHICSKGWRVDRGCSTPGGNMKSDISFFFPTCRRVCARGRMDSWIGTWQSGLKDWTSRRWEEKWDCETVGVACSVITASRPCLLELSNNDTYTHLLTRTQF